MKQAQHLPRKIEFGRRSLSETNFHGKRIVILHGRSTASEAGVDLILKQSPQHQIIFDAYSLQSMDEITCFADEILKKRVDVVIGIGGGSVIDKAKKVGGCLRHASNPIDLIVVPTLPGSGVESSKAIVVNEPRKNIEADDKFLPDHVIYDFGLIAQAGLEPLLIEAHDAVIHGFESFFSAFSNPISRALGFTSLNKFAELVKSLSLIPNHSEDLKSKILEDFCILSFTGGGAQSEVGCGPIHALAHSVESNCGGHHSSLVRCFANVALPYFSDFPKSEEISMHCNAITENFCTLNKMFPYKKIHFEPEIIFQKILSDVKIDPCWRSTRARFPDKILKKILVRASN